MNRTLTLLLTALTAIGLMISTIGEDSHKRDIVFHCSATDQGATIPAIQNYWKKVNGWKSPGYHVIIDTAGKPTMLQRMDKNANGVAGHNIHSIHICYIGGVDKAGRPKDTRTDAQIATMWALVGAIKQKIPDIQVKGHRDFPGVKKACPSFDVQREFCFNGCGELGG